MPVHVEDHHVHGDVVAFHVVDDFHELVGGVALVLAVPISQHIEWRHGLTPCYLDEIAQCLLVLVAISQEIPVDGGFVDRLSHPIDTIIFLVEGESGGAIATLGGRRLVDDAPSSTREESVLQFVPLVVANLSVEGAGSAFEVERVVLSGIPQHIPSVQVERDGEHLVGRCGGADYPTYLILQCQGLGLDIEEPVFTLGGELRHRQVTVDDGERCAVLKLTSVAILYTDHFWGKNREACLTLADHRLWVGHRIVLGLCEDRADGE